MAPATRSRFAKQQPAADAAQQPADADAAQQPQQRRRHKYSVLLPTYNEVDNIALSVWLLVRSFESW